MAPKWGFAQVDQQWYNTEPLLADARRMYDEVRPLAPRYWRIGAAWALIAKSKDPGTLVAGTPPSSTGRDWTTLDTSLNEALLLGAEVVLILGVQKPYWGGIRFGPFAFGGTAPGAADFGVWCAEVATRYKPGGPGIRTDGRYATNGTLNRGVKIFEIWNEENDQNHDGGQISAKDYTDRLIAAYNAIKGVPGLSGSNSKVIFGGTYHVQRIGSWFGYGIASLPEIDYLTQCYSYGAQGKFDAMAVHVYPHLDTEPYNGASVGPVPSMNIDNMRQLVEIRALMVAKGDGAKNIWITEAGFPCSNVTEAQQKTYWEALWALFSALSYVEVVLFYCARDGGTDLKNVESTWGAMRYDFTHKPVWDWLATLNPGMSVALSGAGIVTATVTLGGKQATLTGSGTLSGQVRPALKMTLSGAGVVAATVEKFGERSADLTGTGSLTAALLLRAASNPQLGGGGSVTAMLGRVVAAALNGSGTVSALLGTVPATLTGSGTVTATVSTGVTVDTIGLYTSSSGGSTSTKTLTFTHPGVSFSDTHTRVYFFVQYTTSSSGSPDAQAFTPTYGGSNMTLISANYQTKSGGGVRGIRVYSITNPPIGDQTVSATIAASSGLITSFSGVTVAYRNVYTRTSCSSNGTGFTRVLTGSTTAGSILVGVSTGAAGASSVNGSIRGQINVQDIAGEADGSSDLIWNQSTSGAWITAGMVLSPT